MLLSEAIKDAPHFLRALVLFIIRPRKFVRDSHGFVWLKDHWKGLAAWCIALVIIMVKLYQFSLGSSLYGRMADELDEPTTFTTTEKVALTNLGLAHLTSPTAMTDAYGKSRLPVLRKVSLFSSWGFGLERKTAVYVNSKSDGSPDMQSIDIWNNALGFICGFVTVWFENVAVENLEIEITLLFLISTYVLVTTLSLFFPAKWLGGAGSVTDALKLGFVTYLFTLLYMTVSNLVISFIAFKLLNVPGESTLWDSSTSTPFVRGAFHANIVGESHEYLVGSIWCFTVLPLVRCYWSSFRELFSLSPKRFCAAFSLSIVFGGILTPIIFVPAIYIIVRFAKFWAAIF